MALNQLTGCHMSCVQLYLGHGYLWFGRASLGPADDGWCCNNHINKDDLPDGYLGRFGSTGNGTLAGRFTFTANEIAIYHVSG